MAKRDFIPGDVHIEKIELKSLSGDRCANITGQAVHIDIFECIMTPVIYAELIINDGIDLLTKFPIVGEEYIDIKFKTEGVDKFSTYRFNVSGIVNQDSDVLQKSKAYILKLVSPELFDNSATLITKKFKNDSNLIIKDILNNHLRTDKLYQYESTKGIDEILITDLNPFQAIDQVRQRAISRKHISSSFCFYENKNGYTFATLEHLFDKGKTQIGDKIFFHDSNVNEETETVSYRNILAYNQLQIADSISKIHGGSFNNEVNAYDLITGDVRKINYSNSDGANAFKTIDKTSSDLSTNYFGNKYGKKPAKTFLVPYDSSVSESLTPEKVSILQAFVQRVTQNLSQVHVYGDSAITVGDVITMKLPDYDGTAKTPKENRLISGNYLISKLRHMITLGVTPKHTMSLELIKGSILGSI